MKGYCSKKQEIDFNRIPTNTNYKFGAGYYFFESKDCLDTKVYGKYIYEVDIEGNILDITNINADKAASFGFTPLKLMNSLPMQAFQMLYKQHPEQFTKYDGIKYKSVQGVEICVWNVRAIKNVSMVSEVASISKGLTMKQFNYKGRIITASSKEEAIKIIAVGTDNYNITQDVKKMYDSFNMSGVSKTYNKEDKELRSPLVLEFVFNEDDTDLSWEDYCVGEKWDYIKSKTNVRLFYFIEDILSQYMTNDVEELKKDVSDVINEMKNYLIMSKTEVILHFAPKSFNKVEAIKNIANINDSTKELYDKMNEGDFLYNYRNDDNFDNFINSTLEDEIYDTIRSNNNLIRQCIERRVKNYSIVWSALCIIFNEVKKRWKLSAPISNDKIKNWFVYNGTDYKTSLKKIVDNLSSFRDELRETEASSVTSASLKMRSSKDNISYLEKHIDDCRKYIRSVELVEQFLRRRNYRIVEVGNNFNSEEIYVEYVLENKKRSRRAFMVRLATGFKTELQFRTYDKNDSDDYRRLSDFEEAIEKFIGE